jgi:hypothetical protein
MLPPASGNQKLRDGDPGGEFEASGPLNAFRSTLFPGEGGMVCDRYDDLIAHGCALRCSRRPA